MHWAYMLLGYTSLLPRLKRCVFSGFYLNTFIEGQGYTTKLILSQHFKIQNFGIWKVPEDVNGKHQVQKPKEHQGFVGIHRSNDTQNSACALNKHLSCRFAVREDKLSKKTIQKSSLLHQDYSILGAKEKRDISFLLQFATCVHQLLRNIGGYTEESRDLSSKPRKGMWVIASHAMKGHHVDKGTILDVLCSQWKVATQQHNQTKGSFKNCKSRKFEAICINLATVRQVEHNLVCLMDCTAALYYLAIISVSAILPYTIGKDERKNYQILYSNLYSEKTEYITQAILK